MKTQAAAAASLRIIGGLSVWLFAGAVLAVQWRALQPAGGALWGADAWAFLPPGTAWIVGLVLAGGAVAMIARSADGTASAFTRRLPHPALLFGIAALVFWNFRIRHLLLGDGISLTSFLPSDREIHPREPLAMVFQHVFYSLLHGVFAGAGPRVLVVQDCVAVGSVLAGLAFLAFAPKLAAEIVRAFPAGTAEEERPLTLLVTVLFCAQGYMQIFFGYVENYAFPMLAAELYLLAGLRFLRGTGSIALPLAAAASAVALHYSALALGPSAVALTVIGWSDRSRAARVRRDLAIVIVTSLAALATVQFVLSYPVLVRIAEMLESARATRDYLFSAAHSRDFLNEHLLIGPCGLLLFVPALLVFPWRRARVPAASFLITAGGSVALGCILAPNLPLGYARDWDLYAPLGVVLTGSAIALLLARMAEPRMRRDAMILLATVSAFHTIGWIALNHSERRSIARYETLPLDPGRKEVTMAWWYAMHGHRDEARNRLRRAFAANPGNTRLLDLYGQISLGDHDPRAALRAYLTATMLRPDEPVFRARMATAVEALGGPAVALGMLDTMLAGHATEGGLWFERAMLLRARGDTGGADSARMRAIALRPELAGIPDSLPK